VSEPSSNGQVVKVVQVIVPGEVEAFRRMRAAQALEERLVHEREVEKAGGPPASRW
jgi:hypothetical protein